MADNVKLRFHRSLISVYRNARETASKITRHLFRTDTKIAASYFARREIHGLHIGCGQHLIEDFLNADLSPMSKDVFRLNATKTFPFNEASFDYIFSEHMIEHIPYSDGLRMLNECHRVLKKGGKIRISTPDLQSVSSLCKEELSTLQEDYIAWSVAQFAPYAPASDPAFVINNFFREWGHQFIYARQTLISSLEQCGFVDVTTCRLSESSTPALRSLENEARMPLGFLALETFTLEATKPL